MNPTVPRSHDNSKTKKNTHTDGEIILYQAHVDQWFQRWNELHGAEGCTNYIHMLSSGHIAE